MTPGHPEFPSSHHNTPGIESTTGPLGQGVANAVGMAAAAKMAGARFNTPDHTIFDHSVVALCGDGCLQEGDNDSNHDNSSNNDDDSNNGKNNNSSNNGNDSNNNSDSNNNNDSNDSNHDNSSNND